MSSIQKKTNVFTIADLNEALVKIDSKDYSIHYTIQRTPDDVVNHMPYNTGLFFEQTAEETFRKKSIQNDMRFSKEIFGEINA